MTPVATSPRAAAPIPLHSERSEEAERQAMEEVDRMEEKDHGEEKPSLEPTVAQALTATHDAQVTDIENVVEEPHKGSATICDQTNPVGKENEEVSPSISEDALMTPKVHETSSPPTVATSKESRAVHSTMPAHGGFAPERLSDPEPGGYFPPTPLSSRGHDVAAENPLPGEPANTTESLTGATPQPKAPTSEHSVSNTSATVHPVVEASKAVAGSTTTSELTHQPESTRPTSVPSFHSGSLSRRRDIQDYPHYPNQSFAALQKHPAQPHPLRTRTSNPLQNFSYSATEMNSATNLSHVPSGAKTVGNTPAQSPGLFSPTFPAKKSATESEDMGYSTPMLHPTHLQAPKETHKLMKDIDPISGRKTINQYELYRKLGSGQHGTVKLGRNNATEEVVAVKIVRRFSKKVRLGRGGDPNDRIKKEVAILKQARHPHVVSLYEVIDDEEFSKVYLVLEFVERGEIIWRKSTDKEIAMFEKGRLEREKSGHWDEEHEMAAIEEFNKAVPARREEKARLLDALSREDSQQLEALKAGRRPSLAANFWSLEHGCESENDYSGTSPRHSDIGLDTRLSRADLHAVESSHRRQDSAASIRTPRSHPYPTSVEHFSSSQPGSRPDSPAMLEGTMFGAYSDESRISDLDLQATMSQILTDQAEWTSEEEDYRYVPCLTLNQALEAFRDTVLGLEYLHFQGIMHRDIKPANLLWTTDYRVKISDFGVSYLGKPIREDANKEELPEADAAIVNEDIELAKTVGTPAFYAPELCDPDHFDPEKNPDRPAITGQIDVWALGVTLYCMIFGRLPFYHTNEFKMYEKIARDEVFIPRMRLKGVEHTDKTPSNHNKRLDDELIYEEVEDTLRDLIKRLLAKNPSERISLKEVKHHPWVISGIEDREAWLDQTDPSVQSQGKKIEPSSDEVKDAVVGLTVIDRLKSGVQSGVQRLNSVLRGRGSRKRTDSNPKPLDSPGSASGSKTKEERRDSLGGTESIFSALKASRESSEHHPLAQSVAVSPELKHERQYFPSDTFSTNEAFRPTFDRSLSTADSMKTIRPTDSADREAASAPGSSAGTDLTSNMNPFVEPTAPNASTTTTLFNTPGRFMSNMRSRERGVGANPSQSSRSSSVDPATREDLHCSPSLALSSALAAGHVDQPPGLRNESEALPVRTSTASSTERFEKAQEVNWRRQTIEHARSAGHPSLTHRRSVSQHQVSETPCPPSPDDFVLMGSYQRPASAAESSSGFPAISSSSDILVSGDSTAHSRIPSLVSGASSMSQVAPEEQHAELGKFFSPPTMPLHGGSSFTGATISPTHSSTDFTGGPGLEATPEQVQAAVIEDAGYNGEPEEDSDSSDEGLAMA